MHEDKLTSPEQFIPGLHVRLNHSYYGYADYIVVTEPYTKEDDVHGLLYVLLVHESAKTPVEYALYELLDDDNMWVDTPKEMEY